MTETLLWIVSGIVFLPILALIVWVLFEAYREIKASYLEPQAATKTLTKDETDALKETGAWDQCQGKSGGL
jgi:hypothetical protein